MPVQRNVMCLFATSLLVQSFTPIAAAATLVIGGGFAQSCYQQTEAGLKSPSSVEAICTRALEDEAMSRNDRAATLNNRGIVRMRGGDIKTALDDFDRALRLREDLGDAWLNRGAALIRDGQYALAIEALDKAVAVGSVRPEAAHFNRAMAREQLGDTTGAYFDLLESLEINPDFKDAQEELKRFTVKSAPKTGS